MEASISGGKEARLTMTSQIIKKWQGQSKPGKLPKVNALSISRSSYLQDETNDNLPTLAFQNDVCRVQCGMIAVIFVTSPRGDEGQPDDGK